MKLRIFISIIAISVFFGSLSKLAASDFGRVYSSEKETRTDPVTGRTLTLLTRSGFNDVKPYQTHDTWTADGKWIVFRSDRGNRDRGRQLFLVNEEDGKIVQITDENGVDAASVNLSRKEMKLFFRRAVSETGEKRSELVELDLGKLLPDALDGRVKASADYQRIVAVLPGEGSSVGFALDADESRLYWGVLLTPAAKPPKAEPGVNPRETARKRFEIVGGGKSVLRDIDVRSGAVTDIVKLDFRIGHVQANPWVPGEVLFCHETGGDAPQRMWAVRSDGSEYRPIYVETPDEWVTHETLSGPDEVMFILSGNAPYLREKPTGIAVCHLRNRQMQLLGQTELDRGGFWHCNGSPDRRWAVGDTHRGGIYLIDRGTGERILLSAGHPMKPDHAHPIFSPDSRRVLIQSGIFCDGKSLDLVTVEVPESSGAGER